MISGTVLHYEILEKLGEGGMGVVYMAQDQKLKRSVAIKFLPRHVYASQEDRHRFEVEAQAAAALNHPNIATIHSIEEDGDDVFIVMEYIDGPELSEKLKNGPLNTEESFRIIEQIAMGLQAAHQKGIVHRDIKSSNIMLTKSGQVKIMDFGLAKVKWSALVTREGTTVGTTAYMSPEQARGEKVDRRSDLWSMGVILYEMLTGRLPFRGDFEQAILYSIMNQDIDPVSESRRDLPAEIDDLMKKLLSKDPDERYQDAGAFVSALRSLTEQGPPVRKDDDAKRIAVLPFENISPDKETDYFADGLAEELIINLSKIKEVSVVAKTNSMQYKGTKKDARTIGKELGARYILEGSVRKFKDDLRISAQLIDVQISSHLWGETYKGKLADIFDIQEKVSKEIADALMVKLSPIEKVELTKRPTLNAEAFDCYLRGRNFMSNRNKNNLDFAILLFQKAVELDSRFASAYAGLGEAYGTMYRDFDRKESWLDKAMEASLKALMYDPTLSEAYASLGLAYFGKSELDEALTSSKKAIEFDSNNYNAYWILSRIYHTTDRDKEALTALEKAVSINPNFFTAYDDLEMYYERTGDIQNYRRVLDTVATVVPNYLAQHPEDTYRRMAHAVTLAKLGRIEEAKLEGDNALELSFNDPIMMYYGACLYARLNEKRHAVELLSRAIRNGYENFEWIKRDPDFENIRDEPEYVNLMRSR